MLATAQTLAARCAWQPGHNAIRPTSRVASIPCRVSCYRPRTSVAAIVAVGLSTASVRTARKQQRRSRFGSLIRCMSSWTESAPPGIFASERKFEELKVGDVLLMRLGHDGKKFDDEAHVERMLDQLRRLGVGEDPPLDRVGVVFLSKYSEDGAEGLLLTQPSGKTMEELSESFGKQPLMYGGPSDPETLSILHSFKGVPGCAQVGDTGFYLGTGRAVFTVQKWAAENDVPASKFCFFFGKALWKPGELAREVQDRFWVFANASKDLVFLSQKAGEKDENGEEIVELHEEIAKATGGEVRVQMSRWEKKEA